MLMAGVAPLGALAQTGAHAQLAVEWKALPRLELTLSEEVRLGDRLPEQGLWVTQADAQYRLWGPLEIGGGYRFSGRASVTGLRAAHRLHADLGAGVDLADFRLAWRGRYQTRLSEDDDLDLELQPALRNALTLRWKSPWRLSPFVSAELYSDVDGRLWQLLDRARFELGVRLPLEVAGTRARVEGAYRFELYPNDDGRTYHTLFVGLTWQLGGKERKQTAPAEATAAGP